MNASSTGSANTCGRAKKWIVDNSSASAAIRSARAGSKYGLNRCRKIATVAPIAIDDRITGPAQSPPYTSAYTTCDSHELEIQGSPKRVNENTSDVGIAPCSRIHCPTRICHIVSESRSRISPAER
ncbi:hypothetical protein [Bradyrhizobium sp. USDA 4508]